MSGPPPCPGNVHSAPCWDRLPPRLDLLLFPQDTGHAASFSRRCGAGGHTAVVECARIAHTHSPHRSGCPCTLLFVSLSQERPHPLPSHWPRNPCTFYMPPSLCPVACPPESCPLDSLRFTPTPFLLPALLPWWRPPSPPAGSLTPPPLWPPGLHFTPTIQSPHLERFF